MEWTGSPTGMLRQIQENLQSAGATVATAESCTGGLVGALLTELPGSSSIYLGGAVVYANTLKTALLGVSSDDLARYGAVSEEVAAAMAAGAAERLGATFAVALTGVAGPGGGSREKPVGTVYCAIHGPLRSTVSRLALTGDRWAIRSGAAEAALTLLVGEVAAWREAQKL